MTTRKHIVQIHPVENGEPNLHKVRKEIEYDTKALADGFIGWFNREALELEKDYKAVYRGRVNDTTGELE